MRDALLDPDRSPTLETLERAGFVGFRGDLVGGPIVPLPTGARVVIVMTGEPLLDESAMLELVASLSESGPRRVVVAESAANRDTTSEPEPAFVRRIRADDNLNARLSTVDDLDRLEGRVTTVLALEDLARQEVGHYGLDKSADRLLPEAG